MPARNSIKEFVCDSYYHLYNRGVERRIIFQDSQDYRVFLSYLKTYLIPKDEQHLKSILSNSTISWKEKDQALKLLRLNNFFDTIRLTAYCLMPNHFHLLLHQRDENSIDIFMNSLCTRYSGYFNRKYKRIGRLYQDVYKAVCVRTDEQLLELTRYLHRNPIEIVESLVQYSYSSYEDYLGLKRTDWIHPEEVLSFFVKRGSNSYQSFVEYGEERRELIKDFVIDCEAR